MKKILTGIISILILVAVSFSISAETAGTEKEFDDFKITIPNGMYFFNTETPLDDPSWTAAGIEKPEDEKVTLNEMNGLGYIVSEGGDVKIIIKRKSSDMSERIYNFALLTDEQKAETLDEFTKGTSDDITTEKSIYKHDQTPFFRLKLDRVLDDQRAHEVLYGTFINGYILDFDLFSDKAEITAEQEQILLNIVNTVNFTNVLEKPIVEVNLQEAYFIIALIAILILLIICMLIFSIVRSKAEKKRKGEFTTRISEYRKANKGDSPSGSMKFVNVTECSDEVLHKFAVFHAYRKDLISLIFGALVCLSVSGILLILDIEWWIKLIAVALVVYYIYKISTAPSKIEAVQKKIYGAGITNKANYVFYDNGFRISGVYAASTFPYFQIVKFCETSEFFYLYSGNDNAYIISRKNFTTGDESEFKAYITAKMGEKS